MREKKSIEYLYSLSMQVMCLCEYMYRKGVYDASNAGDLDEVEDFCKRSEASRSLEFLNKDFGRIISETHFRDILTVLARKISADILAVNLSSGPYKSIIGKALPQLAMSYYRKGITDGCEIGPDEGEYLLEEVGKGNRHKLASGRKIKTQAFADGVRLELSILDAILKDTESIYTRLRGFIQNAMIEMEIKKEIDNYA